MMASQSLEAISRHQCDEADFNQAPDIQNLYSLNMPVPAIRTKVRQEFERHRYVNQLPTIDVLIFKSQTEFQVSPDQTLTHP